MTLKDCVPTCSWLQIRSVSVVAASVLLAQSFPYGLSMYEDHGAEGASWVRQRLGLEEIDEQRRSRIRTALRALPPSCTCEG